MQTKNNKNHQLPKIRIVNGQDYNNDRGWWILHDLIERQVNKSWPNQYDPQWLNWMINLDMMPNGFTTGIETTEDNRLQCLLIAEYIPNMWTSQRDCHIVGILVNDKCPTHYTDLMLHQVEWWAKENDCKTISICTWDDRKAYLRWAKQRGYILRQYQVAKELQ